MRARAGFLRAAFLPLALAAVAGAGCSIDENSNPTPRCETTDDCAGGRVCYLGFCILGDSVDGGMDVGFDGDPPDVPRDAPPMCDGRLPAEETCNLEDDDCDGTVDELVDAPTCSTGEQGECAMGRRACSTGGTGALVCRRMQEPTDEACNGRDDDCDGRTDEDAGEICYEAGSGCDLVAGVYVCEGVCAVGRRRCVAGELLTECEGARGPTAEACTTGSELAIDENCDGVIDEGCSPCADGNPCFPDDPTRVGLGACRAGTLACGSPNTCVGFVRPAPEECTAASEGIDDDCDGTVDNAPGTGAVCIETDEQGACRTGTIACPMGGGAPACRTPMMSEMEACDGIDDNCNGETDEGFDLSVDPLNCGVCGLACPTGFGCCGGECIDVRSDVMACGECGNACGSGEACCNGTCSDPTDDADNCGACGNGCGPSGACCDSTCVDRLGDEANCGGCGTSCSGGTPDCCGGTCMPDGSCDVCTPACAGTTPNCCEGQCYDFQTDELHCGDCTTACDAGDVCCGGTCVDSDEDHCGGSCAVCTGGDYCCGGSCVDRGDANCAGCGDVCGAGEDCCGSSCASTSTVTNCGGCGVTCGSGEVCTNEHCCPAGQTYCAGTGGCVRLNANPNCGACGRTCALGLCGLCL